PIEIYAARMHFFHQRAEEPEVVMCGGAKGGAIDSGMHVRDVRTDSQMDGDGNALFVRGKKDAGIRVWHIKNATREELASGFAVQNEKTRTILGFLFQVLAFFFAHENFPRAQMAFNVWESIAGEGD